MSEGGFDALRAAVTLARTEHIQRIVALRSRLIGLGYSPEHISEAIRAWAGYCQRNTA